MKSERLSIQMMLDERFCIREADYSRMGSVNDGLSLRHAPEKASHDKKGYKGYTLRYSSRSKGEFILLAVS